MVSVASAYGYTYGLPLACDGMEEDMIMRQQAGERQRSTTIFYLF